MRGVKPHFDPEKPNKQDPITKGRIRLPSAKSAVEAYCNVGKETDPQGMYTGRNVSDSDLHDRPVQDADDL